jgi:uncharacterized RDD family membrane protein YckC
MNHSAVKDCRSLNFLKAGKDASTLGIELPLAYSYTALKIPQTREDPMAKLLVQESAGVREFELVDNEVQIGRELDNALRLADPSISRHHAVIRRTAAGYEVQDLQSSNGVLVNGTRLSTAIMRDGDRVTMGQIQMTFVDPVSAEAMATMAVPIGEPMSPLGTVRMDPSEMAKIQGLGLGSAPQAPVPAPPAPPAPPLMPVAPPPPMAPPMMAPVAPPPVYTPPPVSDGPRPFTIAPASNEPNPAPAFLQPWLPPVPDPAQPTGERGDFVTRLLAHLIDGGVVMVLFITLWVIQAILMGVLARIIDPGVLAVGCLFGLLQFAIGIGTLIFWPWCWIKFGATPGKKFMKLRVVPEDDPNGRIDVSMAVLRIVGHMVNGMVCSLPYLMILGEERKGLQDILSKSIVIKMDR